MYDMWLSANNKNKLKQNRQTNKQTDKHKKGLDKRTLSAKKTSLLNPDSWDKRPILGNGFMITVTNIETLSDH